MKLVNTSKRARSINTGFEFLVLEPGEEYPVTAADLAEMRRHTMFATWVQRGHLTIKDGEAKKPLPVAVEERKGPELPEGLSGKGTELHDEGGGWFTVWHEGMPCTDEKVRKDRAEEIAKDYA